MNRAEICNWNILNRKINVTLRIADKNENLDVCKIYELLDLIYIHMLSYIYNYSLKLFDIYISMCDIFRPATAALGIAWTMNVLFNCKRLIRVLGNAHKIGKIVEFLSLEKNLIFGVTLRGVTALILLCSSVYDMEICRPVVNKIFPPPNSCSTWTSRCSDNHYWTWCFILQVTHTRV